MKLTAIPRTPSGPAHVAASPETTPVIWLRTVPSSRAETDYVPRTKAGNRQRQNGSPGNAHRNYERYLALAREATMNGEVIEAENFY